MKVSHGSGHANDSRRWFSVYILGHSLGLPPGTSRKGVGRFPKLGVSWKRKGRARWWIVV